MFTLYLIILFFVIIFNIIFPAIKNKIIIQNQILNSNLGKQMTKITCKNNYWFYISPSKFMLDIQYFTDDKGDMLPCNESFINKKTKSCNNEGMYNNKYNPCYQILSELLFYRF